MKTVRVSHVKKAGTRSSACAVVATLLIACGGNQPQPSSSSTSAPTSSSVVADAAPTSTEAPSAAAPSASASASASTPAASAADAASPSSKPVAVGETKDECTPVSVDFEKRARPKLKECYAEGKKKNPNLEGTVKIKMTVDVKGKIKSVKVIEKTLPDPVADCMLKVVKATPFPEVEKCWDASLTIPVTFPTPH